MSYYPCTTIAIDQNVLVAVYGPHIRVLDVPSGSLLADTAPSAMNNDSTYDKKKVFTKPISIRHVAVVASRKLVTIDEQKMLNVLDLDSNLTTTSSRELPKKANQIIVTKDGQTILVADKFGDVFSYPMIAPEISTTINFSQQTKQQKKANKNSLDGRKSLASHSNPSQGALIVGHTSSLLCMILSPDEQFIITADRDEHIRVSRFPRGYNIERYCLGHTKYVSAIHLPAHLPGRLVSGGGDRHLYLWDYMTGDLLDQIEIWDAVYPATKVSSQRRKWKKMEAKAGTGWRAQKRMMKQEREQIAESASPAMVRGDVDDDMDVEMDGGPDLRGDAIGDVVNEDGDADGSVQSGEPNSMSSFLPPALITAGGITINERRAQLPSLEEVIAISKLDTLQFGERYALIFSAVGANAIFVAPYEGSSASSPGRFPSKDSIRSYSFPSPVLDFVVIHGSNTSCHVLVTVDTGFQDESTDSGPATLAGVQDSSSMIAASNPSAGFYLFEWSGGDTFVEQGINESPLLYRLRSLSPIPATDADLKALELYGALTALPKSEEMEEDEGGGGGDLPADEEGLLADEPGQEKEGGRDGSESVTSAVTKKEVKKVGRQKWLEKMKKASGVDGKSGELLNVGPLTRRLEEGSGEGVEHDNGPPASKRVRKEGED
ncbi:tRNA (guanine-N(7)-)-methyltransferase non-catalytic subunit trm82 [Serendipita sp. 399]|nr:tRNA (guanine-N(7)-)-methyltransferase non-catalytic subunit trm82 [Serendipita sp. 399]